MTTQEKINAWKILRKSVELEDHSGLCINIEYSKEILTVEEQLYLRSVIEEERNGRSFIWEPYDKFPRMKWIDKQIEELKIR